MNRFQQLVGGLLNAAPDLGAGAARGMTADVLGTPVDTLNTIRQGLLMPAQAGNPAARGIVGLLGPVQQTGTSDYFAQQMGLPEGQGMAYEAGRMLSPSLSDLMSLARRAPSIQELITYHGTPHQFPATEANPLGEFDASKIGTGEGAQAYGHGVYLAEAPDVATSYKNLVQRDPNRLTVDGKVVSPDTMYGRAAEDVARIGVKATLQKIDDNIRFNEKYAPDMAALYKDLRTKIEALEPTRVNLKEGSLYTVDLPDEMVDRMLDWDKPLSEQPKSVQPILREMLLKSKKSFSEIDEKSNPMAGQIHHLYSMHRGGNSAAVAEELRQKGIPGIKYLDQGSRDKGKGTRNFVVFPGEEKKVKILKRD